MEGRFSSKDFDDASVILMDAAKLIHQGIVKNAWETWPHMAPGTITTTDWQHVKSFILDVEMSLCCLGQFLANLDNMFANHSMGGLRKPTISLGSLGMPSAEWYGSLRLLCDFDGFVRDTDGNKGITFACTFKSRLALTPMRE